MRLTMLQLWQAMRSSYWFVPSTMVALATALGALMVWLDSGPLANLFNDVAWYQQSKPAGAREVLSSIAGSAITVAGVAFSITIVAISFAANQYGPRILTNFMSDRGNQFTLGTFIATFVYCIVVLRTIYSGDTEFVPQLAVVVALLLAFASTAMLIYFIHHVPQSIHVNTVLAGIGRQLVRSIEDRFPSCSDDPPPQSDDEWESYERLAEACFSSTGDHCSIASHKNGYLQAIDDDKMVSLACKHGLILKLERAPGEFLHCGQPLFRATPSANVDSQVEQELRECWSIGSSRTPDQDQLFLVDELVEIAGRALSTGVNDPYTAITCLDWLGAGLAELSGRREVSPYRVDDEGNLRVVAPAPDFALFVDRGLGRLRPYAARDINAACHFLSWIERLAWDATRGEQIQALAGEAEALVGLATDALRGPSRERLDAYSARTMAALTEAKSRLSGPMIDTVSASA